MLALLAAVGEPCWQRSWHRRALPHPLQKLRRPTRRLWSIRFLRPEVVSAAEKPAAPPSAAAVVPARLKETYVKSDGSGYFALILPPLADLPRAAGHDIVVLFDTSASQVGEARARGSESTADASCRCVQGVARSCIYLAAVDVAVVPLTSTFVSPKSSELQEALDKLVRRVPLGATDLPPALEHAAGVYSSSGTNAKAVVYIGDGVSAAQLFIPAAFAKLTDQLVEQQIPVFSYGLVGRASMAWAVHPLAAALANYTGGTIVLDDGSIDPKEAGIFLAASARGPVAWPDATTWPKIIRRSLSAPPDSAARRPRGNWWPSARELSKARSKLRPRGHSGGRQPWQRPLVGRAQPLQR